MATLRVKKQGIKEIFKYKNITANQIKVAFLEEFGSKQALVIVANDGSFEAVGKLEDLEWWRINDEQTED